MACLRHDARRLGQDGDRGATMLEFALVVPFLLLLAFGTAEMGMAWTAHNRIEGAVSAAARVGSSAGSTSGADVTTLRALKAALPSESMANLDRVIIFKPTNADGGIPAGCMKAVGSTDQVGVSNQCNTYSGATVRGPLTGTDPLGTADDYWLANSTQRRDSLAGPPDSLGAWIRTTHKSKTGTFFKDYTITRQSIYRLQPDIDG